MSKLFAKYLDEISGQPIENGYIDPTFHSNDIARVGTRIAQITNLPFWVDDREIVLIEDIIYTGKMIKATLEALFFGVGQEELWFFQW